MCILVQWATILSPIIAIVIAVIAIYCSSKDTDRKISAIQENTAKQIAALEESTAKQIESIRELAEIQIELSSIQLQKDISEARTSYLQVSKRAMDEMERDEAFNHIGGEYEIIRQRQDRRRDLVDKGDFITKHLEILQIAQTKLNALKKKKEDNREN